jgi:hypothetical protein
MATLADYSFAPGALSLGLDVAQMVERQRQAKQAALRQQQQMAIAEQQRQFENALALRKESSTEEERKAQSEFRKAEADRQRALAEKQAAEVAAEQEYQTKLKDRYTSALEAKRAKISPEDASDPTKFQLTPDEHTQLMIDSVPDMPPHMLMKAFPMLAQQSRNASQERVATTAAEARRDVSETAAESRRDVAQTTAEARRDVAETHAESRRNVAETTAEARRDVAKTAAESRRGVAETTAEARRDVAKTAAESRRGVAETTAEARRDVAKTAAESRRDVAQTTAEARRDVARISAEAHRDVANIKTAAELAKFHEKMEKYGDSLSPSERMEYREALIAIRKDDQIQGFQNKAQAMADFHAKYFGVPGKSGTPTNQGKVRKAVFGPDGKLIIEK